MNYSWMTKLIYDLGLMLGYVTQKHKKRPHQDFSTEVHITPSSFRYMPGHQEIMDH